jgi:diguanylate cyclase (GGDEF)-like protein/PAS domain S-box-containing protein
MLTTFRKFIKIFGVLSLGFTLVAAWFLYSSNRSHLDLVLERQQSVVRQVTDTISRDLHAYASDARFLARLVGRYHEYGHLDLRVLEDFFIDFSRSRGGYFSLRYLNEKGMELVRVDRSYVGPVITPRTVLQDKSDRYYFKKTIKSSRNDVYVSSFDLNIENGEIEIPYRPTLRFGCPVVDREGKKRGVVILNLEGKDLLNSIRQSFSTGEGVVMLSSWDGYWMLGPTPEEEWGHLLEGREDSLVGQRFPLAWSRMDGVNSAQFQNSEGLFSFETVGVTPDHILTEGASTQEDPGKRWRVMTWVPKENLTVPWMFLYIVLAGVLLGLFAMGCWQVADNLVHQEEVENLLRETEERTMAISHSSQDAIAMINNQGSIIHWNPAAERLFGYGRSEVMGGKLHDLVGPREVMEQVSDGLRAFASSGQGLVADNVMDFVARHRNGTEVPVELSASSFQFKNEWYAVGTMRDITRRRRSEMELKRSEETSRALINAPTESAMLIALNGTIESINKVGAERMGGEVADFLGKNAFDLVAKDFKQRGRLMVSRIQETGEPIVYEDERGDRRMLINIYPVRGADDSVDRLAIFVRDVTEQRLAEAALVHSEQRFRDVSEAVGDIIWETDSDGMIVFLTADIEDVVGFEAEQLLGKPMSALLPQEDVDDFNHWRDDVYRRQEAFTNVEARTVDSDGNIIWLQISGTPYFDADGIFQGYRGAAMDITDRKDTETAIKASERKLRALAESAYDAIIMIDARGRVSFWNDAAEQLFGYTEREVLGRDLHPLISPPEGWEEADRGMGAFSVQGTGPGVGTIAEVVAMHKDGTRFEAERSIASFRLEGEWYAVATIRDITERKATEAKLLELATTDSLTGLYNRRRFMELCEQEFSRSVRYSRSLAMFMLDIDHFKKVNDEYGHDAGDKVLRSLSEVSASALRGADILGRLGGEEFGVLLPETDAESAYEVAERLREAIANASISVNGSSLKVTVSIGISILSPEMHSIDALLKGADVALYQAKQTGRNKVVTNVSKV